jgi:hypothetical protein
MISWGLSRCYVDREEALSQVTPFQLYDAYLIWSGFSRYCNVQIAKFFVFVLRIEMHDYGHRTMVIL